MRAILLTLALALATLSPQLAGADSVANPDGLDTPQSRLSDARIGAAHHAFDLARDRWQRSAGRPDDVYLWSHRVLESELDREPKARIDSDKAYKDHLTRMQGLEAAVTALHNKGLVTDADVAAAAYYRAEAEFLFENYRIM
jgi:hypothetical protein